MAHNTEIKVNGMLMDVVEFDNSAQDIDDAATKSKWQSNPDLLDNSVFLPGCLVDQRGGYVVPPGTQAYSDSGLTTATALTGGYRTVLARTSTYIAFRTANGGTEYVAPGSEVRGYTGAGYGIDRWTFPIGAEGTVTIADSGCLKIEAPNNNSYFVQQLESGRNIHGEQAVLTVLTADGVLKSVSGIVDTVNGTQFGVGLNDGVAFYVYSAGQNHIQVHFYVPHGASVEVKALKLELGTKQTLAHLENGNWVLNELPRYTDTLARCQRYYQLYSSADKRPEKAVDCRPVMRADPSQGTIVIGGTTYYYNTAEL